VSGQRRHWGFHRLTAAWAADVVADARVRPGDLVLDVGAGTGAITEQLVRAGARVIAVELHPARHRILQERFHADDVVVVRADACDLRLPRRPFKVVSNPPFAVTTSLMKRLLAPGSRLVDAHPSCSAPPPSAGSMRARRVPAGGVTSSTSPSRGPFPRTRSNHHLRARAPSSWCVAGSDPPGALGAVRRAILRR
jgi:SAM-dependent methyltransferase